MKQFIIFLSVCSISLSAIVGKCQIMKFLDAGIQDVSTSISIVHDLNKCLMVMKVTNIYKHEIVDTRA